MAFRIYEPNSLESAFCPYESVQAFWANWEFVDESQPPACIMPFRNTGHHGVAQLSGNESSR